MSVANKPAKRLNADLAVKLRAEGQTLREIAPQIGSMAESDSGKAVVVSRLLNQVKYAEICDSLIERSHQAVTDEKIEKADYADLTKGITNLAKSSGLSAPDKVETRNLV